MQQFTLYKITNKVNGKFYIGQTIRSLNERWRSHKIDARNGKELLISRAIRKYGEHNFYITELCKVKDIDELNELEEFVISETKAQINGYNVFPGGTNSKHTEETKRKIQAARIGRKHTIETRKKLSVFCKGRRLSQESVNKIRAKNTGKKMTAEQVEKSAAASRKPILQLFNGELVRIWPSATEAARYLGLDKSGISEACHGKRKLSGGYSWAFANGV